MFFNSNKINDSIHFLSLSIIWAFLLFSFPTHSTVHASESIVPTQNKASELEIPIAPEGYSYHGKQWVENFYQSLPPEDQVNFKKTMVDFLDPQTGQLKEGAYIVIEDVDGMIIAIYEPDWDYVDLTMGRYLDDLRVKMEKGNQNGS